MEAKIAEEENSGSQASKRRKVAEKTVVTVKIKANEGKQRSEGPPSDCWSWRKYGQKPIKGSPYPRGYYRCSTSKGCSAKKQVERCRTDASVLVITYTSTHNHPGPDLPTTKESKDEFKAQPTEDQSSTPKMQEESSHAQEEEDTSRNCHKETKEEDEFHYSQSPFNSPQDMIMNRQENPFAENLDSTSVLLNEEPLSCPPLMAFSATKSEENDFYDELEELPSASSFTSFLRSSFIDERITVPFLI